MAEKKIENHLVDQVKHRGGIAPKFVSPGMSGVSDRLVLLPVPPEHQEIVHRYVKLVEVKDRGEVPRPLQVWWMKELARLGHCGVWIDRKEQVEELLR
jgi:hypothetical protein